MRITCLFSFLFIFDGTNIFHRRHGTSKFPRKGYLPTCTVSSYLCCRPIWPSWQRNPSRTTRLTFFFFFAFFFLSFFLLSFTSFEQLTESLFNRGRGQPENASTKKNVPLRNYLKFKENRLEGFDYLLLKCNVNMVFRGTLRFLCPFCHFKF